MVLCFARAASWQWVNQHSSHAHLTPRAEHLLNALSLALPLFPAAGLLWAAVSRRMKARLGVVLGLMILLGIGGAFTTLFVMVPFFEGHFETSVPSPDGEREAHVHVGGLLGCHASLYVAERRAIWGELVTTRDVDCKDIGARWLTDGGVEITGAPPTPFYFGPH